MNNDEIKVKLSYGVDYYKGDKGDKPIKGVDYFTEQDINEIIETIQAGEYDLTSYATKDYVDNAVAGMIVEETDPTVPEWAKQATKPSYDANEVGALPADTQLFSGDYEDLSNKPTIPTVPSNVSAFTNDAGYLTEHQSLSGYATENYVDTAFENYNPLTVVVSSVQETDEETGEAFDRDVILEEYIGDAVMDVQNGVDAMTAYELTYDNEIIGEDPETGEAIEKRISLREKLDEMDTAIADIDIPTNVSAFTNDAGYLTEHQSLTDYATKAYVDDAIADIPAGGITVETDPTVPSWAKQASKPTYTAQEVGALPANTELFSGSYEDLTNKPTLSPAPIVIQVGIASQPSVVNGVYTLPLTITSNNMAEAYAQYQTHPSTVGIALDLTAMGLATKMYMDCESFYRYNDGNGGYDYETYGEFNDSSLSQQFGYEFMNVNIHLDTGVSGSKGTLAGLTTVNQLASKANSADLATVATSGDYNDLSNKPTIPIVPSNVSAFTNDAGYLTSHQSLTDYATKSYVDTSIANIPSGGGTTYSAGNGISISNNTISADTTVLATKAEIPTVSITPTDGDARGTLTIGNTPIIIGDGLTIETDPDMGTAMVQCSLEVPSVGSVDIFTTEDGYTETRKIIDGIGIGAGLDVVEGTDPYASPADEAGTQGYWLVATGNSSGSGTTYTAGQGIDIDSNGVISQNFSQLGILHILPKFSVPNSSNWRTTLQALADSLNNTGYGVVDASALYDFTPAQLNEALGNKQYGIEYISDMNYSASNPVNITTYNYNSTSTLFSRSARDMYYFIITPTKIYYAKSNLVLLRYLWYSISTDYITVSTNGAVNYTDFRLPLIIKQLDTAISSKQDAIIPTAPTTDGNYVLQATVADGAVVYDWVEVSVGGSY